MRVVQETIDSSRKLVNSKSEEVYHFTPSFGPMAEYLIKGVHGISALGCQQPPRLLLRLFAKHSRRETGNLLPNY
jgi:hypothetical protein